MMNSINAGMMPPLQSQAGALPLSQDQLSGLSKVLEQYDPDTLSQSDAEDIVAQIKGLGIEPGKGLATAMGESGFDAGQIGGQANVGKSGPPPPPPGGGQGGGPGGAGGPGGQSGTVNSEAITALTLLMEDYTGEDISDDDWNDILTAMDDSGYDMTQSLLDVKF